MAIYQIETILKSWVDAFNAMNSEKLAEFYTDNAVNFQIPTNQPVIGKSAIRAMFEAEFKQAKMVCIIEHIHVTDDYGILEWSDPLGLRGCGFFEFKDGLIIHQRGYWDKLSFLKMHNLPLA